MRKFIIYSSTASTNSRIGDLRNAGRWDIILHSIISALFASNEFRKDVELHIIAMGPPNAPRHIIIKYSKDNTISKKNLKKLIEIAMRKYKNNKTIEIHPGVQIDNKTIEEIIKEELNNKQNNKNEKKNNINKENKNQNNNNNENNIFLLDKNGIHIKNTNKDLLSNGIFILGDYDGFDKKIKKFLKKNSNIISLGNQMYFTSQAITIINYELDNLN